MHGLVTRSILSLTIAAGFGGSLDIAWAAPTNTQKCEAALELASGKLTLCRLKAEATYTKTLDAVDRDAAFAKCSASFTTAYDKAIAKFGDSCNVSELASAFDDFLSQCTSGAAAAASGAAFPSGTCAAGTTAVGPGCWRLGAQGEDCNTVCAAVGLAYDAVTESYAGSAGSLASCAAVLAATGGSLEVTTFDCSAVGPIGCSQSPPSQPGVWCSTPAATASGAFAAAARACACQ